MIKLCECGCGQPTNKGKIKGEYNRFINHHHAKDKNNANWKNGVTKKDYCCKICGKKISYGFKKQQCKSCANRNRTWSEETRKKMLLINKNRICLEETKLKISNTRKAKHIKLTQSHKDALFAKCHLPFAKGKDNPAWKGGISSLDNLIRKRLYNVWTKPIFIRDNWTCRHCGAKRKLTPHHIRKFTNIRNLILAKYPQLSIQIIEDKFKLIDLIVNEHKLKDGITLCEKCHQKEHPEIFIKRHKDTYGQ